MKFFSKDDQQKIEVVSEKDASDIKDERDAQSILSSGLSKKEAICNTDANQDGIVNYADVIMFWAALGSNNSDFDINNDGYVNYTDVSTAVARVGQKCRRFKQISSGVRYTCGISRSKRAYCWGFNYNGQLGNGSNISQYLPTQVDTSLLIVQNNFKQIDTGATHTCGISANNTNDGVFCWGNNSNGQLGSGNNVSYNRPTYPINNNNLVGGNNFLDISSGFSHSCGVGTDFKAYCWGLNNFGQLGAGNTNNTNLPVSVSNNQMFDIDAGDLHSAGNLYLNSSAATWGAGSQGQLGNYGSSPQSTPVTLYGLPLIKLTAGSQHSCAIHALTAAVYCWGSGQMLGNGNNTNTNYPVPINTSGLGIPNTFVSVSTSNFTTCAIHQSGAVYCWGTNQSGQLGNGTTSSSLTPVEVDTTGINKPNHFTQISAGNDHTCAIHENGETYCWGSNSSGCLGTGNTNISTVPIAVSTLNIE